MTKDSILLLGGGGFIGTALAKRLVTLGRKVHVVGRKPYTENNSAIHFHSSSLDDEILLKKLCMECEVIVHLAATTTPGSSAQHPFLESGLLTSTLKLLEILQTCQDTRLVFISSGGSIYGNPEHNPVTEDTLPAPRSNHGAGKLAIEAFLNAHRASGHRTTILRPSNTYGPGQNLQQGFGLIRTLLQHIKQGSPMEIWGDGENVRDFIYIDDVVEAILQVLATPHDNGTYNVGSGKGYTLNQVLTITQQVCNTQLAVNYHAARKSDVRDVILDISRIHSELNWSPAIPLEEGIRRTWHWLNRP